MDYLIAGLGIGAVLAIIGFLLRELGLSHRRSFPRWMADTGAALMIAASIIWAVTAAAFFLGMDDDAALDVVLGTVAVAGLGSIVAAAIMTRLHKPAAAPAAIRQTAQVEEPVAPAAVAEMAEPESPAAAEPAESEAFVEETAVEPAAEKNWEEIWRQTWGSEAVRKLAPAAAIEESETKAPMPVDEAVLESWEAPVEAGSEASEAEPKDVAEESMHVTGATEPELPVAGEADSQELAAPSADRAEQDAIEDTSGAEPDQQPDTEPSVPVPHESSPNGIDPEVDSDQGPDEADLTNTRSHQQ